MTDSHTNLTALTATDAHILTVSELNHLAHNLLEQSFPLFWVAGEVSNFTRASSGHWYFSLKDTNAQVRCAMFKNYNASLDWQPKEGDKIEARAFVTLYEARGEFQLNVEWLQRAGLGVLFEAFEKLKAKLQAEGLFDTKNKRPLPTHPKQIGIVTSTDAAALRDVLTTLKRRMPAIPVIVYPSPVQGKTAPQLIAQAIRHASKRAECDVLIICRGGGSIEDLWSFNEEMVARAIAECSIPTISGVGHETDFTISDFVADHRAATPTAAAELASPMRESLLRQLQQTEQRLKKNLAFFLNQWAQSLDYLARRLISPHQQITEQRNQLTQVTQRLNTSVWQQLRAHQQHLLRVSQNLMHLNPHAVLMRGYALVQNKTGTIIHSSQQLSPEEKITLTFGKGTAAATVEKTSP